MEEETPKRKKLSANQYRKNQMEAQRRWRQKHAKSIALQFNVEADADILQKLEHVNNKVDYIRKLIRADIVENGID